MRNGPECLACGFEFSVGDHTFTDDDDRTFCDGYRHNDRTFCDGYCHNDYLTMRAEDSAGDQW